MDDTTNSVYITKAFAGYAGKTSLGKCEGDPVVMMKQGCNNLNNMWAPGRIQCVRFVGSDGSF